MSLSGGQSCGRAPGQRWPISEVLVGLGIGPVSRRLERVRIRTRSSVRQIVWWVWPSHPTSWSAVPARLRPAASQIARLTLAAVVAYLVADALSPGLRDLTVPLTALLVVQASMFGTLQLWEVRVGSL